MRNIFFDRGRFREAVNLNTSSESYPMCGVGEEITPQAGDRLWFGLSSPGSVRKLENLGLGCEVSEAMDGDWSTAILTGGD